MITVFLCVMTLVTSTWAILERAQRRRVSLDLSMALLERDLLFLQAMPEERGVFVATSSRRRKGVGASSFVLGGVPIERQP